MSLAPANVPKKASSKPAPTITSGNDTLIAQAAYGSRTCYTSAFWNGGPVDWCGQVYINGPGFSSSVGEWEQFIWQAYDACGHLVDTYQTGQLVVQYPSGGTYLWYQGGGPRQIPWNEPSGCDGTWSVYFWTQLTFPDGVTLSDSITQATTTVYPDASTAAEALAQSYGGSAIHARQGDPVDTYTGAFNYAPSADAVMAALGGPLEMRRTYASNDSTSGPLGTGWSFTYEAFLTTDATTGNVTFHASSGSEQVFTPNGSGGYNAPLGIHSTLASNPDGTKTLTLKDQTRDNFNSQGQLVSTLNRDGQGLTLAYNSSGQLSTVAGSGRSLSFVYDPSTGRMTGVALSDGRSVSYQYNSLWQLSAYIDAAGNKTTYAYDAGGRLNSVQDPNGNYPVRLTYDQTTGRVTSQQDGNGNVTQFAWNASTNTATITDPRKSNWTDVYLNGYIVEQADPLGNQTRYSWDSGGNLARVSDSLGDTTLMSYDGNGNLAQRMTGTGASEDYAYNARSDLTTTTDFNGTQANYTYDANGNLTTIQRPDVSTDSNITAAAYSYNANGTVASSTDALGKVTSYGYDSQGDLTSLTDPVGDQTTHTYDAAGRRVSTVDPRGNVSGANPDNYRTKAAYDSDDRVISVTDPLGDATKYGLDAGGRLQTVTDARNNVTTYSYDADNHQTAVQGAIASIAPLKLAYDGDGNLVTRTDSLGNITTYTYDSANRLTSTASPTGTWQYGNDAAGQLLSETAPSGRKVSFQRNRLGLVTQTSYSDSTPTVTYAYDGNGNRTSMTDGSGTVSYKYNVLNLPTQVTRGSDTFQYSYDNDGHLTSRTFPGVAAETYAYDGAGRLTTVGRGTTTQAQYSYNQATGEVTITLGNGVVVTQDVDAAQRPSQIKAVLGSTTLTRSAYTLDPDGNPTAVVDQSGNTNTYVYDALDRLSEVCFSATSCASPGDYIQWAYDADNNRVSEARPGGTTSYTYNSSNQLRSRSGLAGAASYTYDADGNLTGDGSNTYSWNAAGQLASVATKKTTTYSYDGDNHRIKSVVGTSTTQYLWDPAGNKLALERDGSNNPLRSYSYGASLLGHTTSGADYYYLSDDSGSVRAVTDSGGSLQWTYSYEPYGTAKATTQVSRSAPANPLQFIGGYNDGSSYDLIAREYNPTNGVFLSPDGTGVPGVDYGYASANPMSASDPTGRSGESFVETVHAWSTGLSMVAGGITLACTVAVVCAEVDVVTGPLALASAAVSAATSNSTISCVSGKGGCGAAVVEGAIVIGGGLFGLSELGPVAEAPEAEKLVATTGRDVIHVDPGGNAIKVPEGGSLTGSPDSRWLQVRDANGEPTGARIDKGHPSHLDPRAQAPHAHVPGVTNDDGTPWLPIYPW